MEMKRSTKYEVRSTGFGKIGVLMGGPSSEREISLKSARAVFEALDKLGLQVAAIDIKTDDLEENLHLIGSRKIDCAFIALHGRFGEDGQIQEILNRLKIRYTGSDVCASRLAMDKAASRRVFEANGLTVPKYRVIDKLSYNNKDSEFYDSLGLPLVIKPTSHGSSIGMSIVDKKEDLGKAFDLAFGFDERVLMEEYIQGREVTVGILGDNALPVIEIVPKKRFFDYEAKYHPGLTDYILPANLNDDIANRVQSQALTAHRLLGCYGCSRVDIILNRDNIPHILEVNSIPGLTQTSLLPKAAKLAGIEFSGLCLKLIEMAYEEKPV